MAEQYNFNAFSFFSGMLAGLIIKWTDIIPIFGGFMLGMSVKKLPEFISYNDLPVSIRRYLDYFGSFSSPPQPTVPSTEQTTESAKKTKKTS